MKVNHEGHEGHEDVVMRLMIKKRNLVLPSLAFGIFTSVIVSIGVTSAQDEEKDRRSMREKQVYKTQLDPNARKRGKFIKATRNGVKDQYIVRFIDEVTSSEVEPLAKELASEFNGSIVENGIITIGHGKGFVVNMSEEDAEKLSKHPKVERVTQDYWIENIFPVDKDTVPPRKPEDKDTTPSRIPDESSYNLPLAGSGFRTGSKWNVDCHR
jgi:hypothetical protein